MLITVDRIENGVVVAELSDRQTVNLPALLFPGAAEGDVYIIEKDVLETEERRKRIAEKMKGLFGET